MNFKTGVRESSSMYWLSMFKSHITVYLVFTSPRGAVLSYKQKYRAKQVSYAASPLIFEVNPGSTLTR